MKRKGLKRFFNGMLASLMALSLTAVSLPMEAQAASAETQKLSDEAQKIENDIFWEDTDGNTLYSQGGGIFKFGNTYYWYGVKYKNAPNYVSDPTKYYTSGDTYSDFESITCYSSTDLVNWKFEGDVVTEADVSYREEMEGVKASWVGRLGVAKVDDTYVMLVQHECDDPDNSLDKMEGYTEQSGQEGWSKQVLVLTSDSPTGKFEWNQRINMFPYTGGTTNTGDQTVFTDSATGKSYLVYSYGVGRGKIFLSEIENQGNGKFGLSLEKNYLIYNGTGREGDCMFEYNGDYYLCASDLYGWNASHAYYLKLDSLDDEYLKNWTVSKNMNLMDGCSDDYCHVTQTGFFYTVQGSEQETVIFCGDRWAEFAGNGLGFNQWCPLSFDESGTPYFNSLSSWYLDEETGNWSVAEDNNYVKNGSFDADRVSVTTLTGWTNSVTAGNSPIKNSSNRTTGKYGLALTDTVAFDCSVSQVIQSSPYVELPDGVYTLSARVKNGGDFDNLEIYAKSNGLKAGAGIKESNSDWTTVTLADVNVTGGKAEIGIAAKGAANAYCYVDDMMFVRTGDKSSETGSITGTIQSDIAGITLAVEAVQTNGTAAYTYEAELTEGEQNFTLGPVKAGTYSLAASTYGCAIEAEGTDVTVASGQTASGVVFRVANNMGSVKGKVADETGEAVSDVAVTLSKGTWKKETVTDSNGEYAFSDVEAGEYDLSFEKVGYSSEGSIKVSIVKGETAAPDKQILVRNTGIIEGKVYDASGQPAANATVMLRGSESVSDTTRISAVTDENGKYAFKDVVAGIYTITASDGNWDTDVNAVSQNVEVKPDEITDVNLDIPSGITIVNGGFESGMDGNRQPKEGWTTTGTSGRASNEKNRKHVYAGNYGYTVWTNNAFTVGVNQTITGLENGTYVVNAMVAAGTYSDSDTLYLFAKDAKGNIISKENVPITGNTYNSDNWELIGLTAEVTDGILTIGMEGSLPGGAWANFDNFRVGKIGEVHEPINGGIISGTVTDASGAPAANAEVMLRGCNSVDDTIRATVQADENGRYTFENVVPGTYAVSASQGKWDAAVNAVAQNVKVVKGDTTTLDLDIPTEVAIVNGGFEEGSTTGWSSTGTSGKASNDARRGHVYSGSYGYTTWKDSAFTVALEQKLTGLENGTYVVQVTAAAGTYGAEDELYLYAKNADGEVIAREDVPLTVNGGWEMIGLTVEVTDGTLAFGLDGDMPANAWANFDDFRIGKIGGSAVVTVDKTKLEALISEVQSFDTSAYTGASVSEYQTAVQEALTEAEKVQKSETAAQEEVDAAVDALSKAFASAKEKLVTLEAKLAQGIADSIKDVKAQEEYTPESWAAYEEALNAAQALQGNDGLTEEKADAAIADLKAAVSGLAEQGDKTVLESLLAEVKEFDTTAYTEASVSEYQAAIQTALDQAEAVMRNDNAVQTEIDSAVSELETAFAAAKEVLVKASVDPKPGDEDGDKPVKPDDGSNQPSTPGNGDDQKPSTPGNGNAQKPSTPNTDKGNVGKPVNNTAVKTADAASPAWFALIAAAAAVVCVAGARRRKRQ